MDNKNYNISNGEPEHTETGTLEISSSGRRQAPSANSESKVQESTPAAQTQEISSDAIDGDCPTKLSEISTATIQQNISNERSADRTTKKKRMRGRGDAGGNTVLSLVKAFVYIIFVVIAAAALSIALIAIGNDMFAFVKNDVIVEVTIPENATIDDIAEILASEKVISYPTMFRLYAQLKKDNGKFVAGTYSVSPTMDYEDLIYTFKEKSTAGTVRIMIPEGYTTDEIIDLFISYGIGVKGVTNSREDYIKVINEYEFDYWFIEELEQNGYSEDRYYRLDGYLFPDTYEFYLESTPEAVINKLLRRFEQIYTDVYKERAEQLGMTTDEIITLASLIEKEAKYAADRKTVSSVFHNRLKNPYSFPKLQSDATIMYAIHHDTGERKNELTGEDTNYPSPYNSYTNDGLPPGPIANSSLYSIRCALYPSDTTYYYFISDSSGNIIAASTLQEHQKNIDKYLKKSD